MRKFIALGSLVLIGAAPPAHRHPAGEGVLCAMAFVDVSAEVGRRCFPGKNPAFQARVEKAEKRFDAYFMKNTPATAEQLAEFKREQAGVGDPSFDCSPKSDLVLTYKHLLAVKPRLFTSGLGNLLARPGKPTFGDCT